MKIISKLKEIFKNKNNLSNITSYINQKAIIKKQIEFNQNIKDLEVLNCVELLDVISDFPQDIRKQILNNTIIKNKLKEYILEKCELDTKRYITYLKSKLTVVEILSLLDVQSIRKTYNNNDFEEYKLFRELCSTEEETIAIINYLLNHKEMFLEYMKQIHFINQVIKYLDYNTKLNILNKLYEYKAKYYLYYFVTYIPISEQIKLVSNDLDENILIKILAYLNFETINYLFKTNNKMEYILYRFKPEILINSNIIFPKNILNSPKFFDILKNESFIVFRNNINLIEKHNLPEPIENNLKKYYKELISSYNPNTNVFKQYDEIINNSKKSELILSNRNYIIDRTCEKIYRESKEKNASNLLKKYQKLTNYKLSEIIVDALFQDNIYNVILNIKEMIRFNSKLPLNEKILDESKLEFYNLILKLDTIPSNEKIKIYNNLKDKNINLMFYKDLRNLKDKSYEIINKSLFKIDNYTPDQVLSKKYKVPIYNMENQEYFMLVRSEDSHQKTTETKRNCYSIISNDNSITYGSGSITIYGYNILDIDKVLHIYEKDAYSSDIDDQSTIQKNVINRIMTPEEIVNSSTWYSEIQIINSKSFENDNVYLAKNPDYIISYNAPSYYDLAESKRLNIPIVIIKEQKLEQGKQIEIETNIDKDDIVYVNNRGDEIVAKTKLR